MSDKLACVATNFDEMEFMDQDYQSGIWKGIESVWVGSCCVDMHR
jgi:hypothetical protein